MAVNDIANYFFNESMKKHFEDELLYSLQLEINTDCGQNCCFCYVRNTVPKGTMLKKGFISSVLEQTAKMGVHTIEWLGGDPLRHPNFWELLELSIDLGLNNNIWSTGDLINDSRVISFLQQKEQGFVSIHLDTLNPKIYQQLSANPTNFITKVQANLEKILDVGIPANRLYNCMTFTKLQAGEDFRKTIQVLYKKYGLISGIVPYKHVVPISELAFLVPSSQEIYEALAYRSSLIYDNNLPIIPQCVSKFYCGTTCSLTVEKELTPCTRIRHAIGRVEGTDFQAAFSNAQEQLLKTPLRKKENLAEACKSCISNTICWGCRGNAWYYGGDFLGKDPKCWRQ